MAAEVVFKLGGPHGRIQRDRDGAGEQHPEKAEKILKTGRQHEGHVRPGFQAKRLQAGGNASGLFEQLPVGDGHRFVPGGIEEEVRLLPCPGCLQA